MSRASLEQAVPAGEAILLDSSSIIAHLDGGEPVSPLATHVIDGLVRNGRNPGAVSTMTVMEVLVGPLRRSRADYQRALDFLAFHPNLHIQPIDLAVALETAGIRATHRLPTPDSLIIGTGLVCHVGRLVTNDERWKTVVQQTRSDVGVVYLADHLPWS